MTTPAYDPTHPAWTHALEQLRPELAAIPGDQLEPIRHDIPSAVIAVLGLAKTIKVHRDEVAREIGESAAAHIDRLEEAARACGNAHVKHLGTMHGTETIEMVEELSQQRRVLLAEARSLVSQKRLSASALAELVGGTGREALCFDSLQLVAAFRGAWTSVAGITAVTVGELDHVEAIANVLATTLGENEHAGSPATPNGELRQRAYTYFVRTYDEVRRAITFVRWDEDDADDIAPSLSAGRKHHAEDGAPEAPVANGAAAVPVGMPGGSPFTASS